MITHTGGASFQEATPSILRERVDPSTSQSWGVLPYLCLRGLTYKSDHIRRGMDVFSGVSHVTAYCTYGSRGLSAIAEFLVKYYDVVKRHVG